MVEIKGEVDNKERGHLVRTGIVKLALEDREAIPFLRLRVLVSSGKIFQVLYKGETPGDVDIGDKVIINGVDKGGVIHTRRIYNETTQSWVTPMPNWLDKLFGD